MRVKMSLISLVTPCFKNTFSGKFISGNLLPASVTVWPVQVLHHQTVHLLLPFLIILFTKGLAFTLWPCFFFFGAGHLWNWGPLHTAGAPVRNSRGTRA